MPRSRILVIATVLMAIAAFELLPSEAQAITPRVSSSAGAHIVARPDSVMVNKTTKLTGKHFAASKRITLEECGQSTWIVLANPCDTNNTIKVKTNAQGQFTTVFTVHTCPSSTTPGFSQTCYIGEPLPRGVDTITLEGAVTITVTGP